MAARQAIRRHAAPFAAAALASGSIVLFPRTAFAESPESQSIPTPPKKPIYDDPNADSSNSQSKVSAATALKSISSSSSSSSSSSEQPEPETLPPTPTDRLATQIRYARLTLFKYSQDLETKVNENMTRALNLESSLANTVASLAPPRTANEPLVPGLTYTLVAMLAGSIITRNRGIVLRFSVPVAFGLAAANAAMPATMTNVGDLVWKWEEQYPEIARAHLQAKERVQRLWETGKDHSAMTKDMITDKVDEARQGVEDWVKKGK